MVFELDIIQLIILGYISNILFSNIFIMYLGKNIGIKEMISLKKEHFIPPKTPPKTLILNLLPFGTTLLIYIRIFILQFYFLNNGYNHKDYWIYLMKKKS